MPLMLWLSPAFPVGAFAYSHGLEWAVEAGDIHDARSLGGWLVDLLTFGAPRADAILFAAAYRAAEAGDWPRAVRAQRACRRARAARPSGGSRRRRRARAFVAAARAAWDCEPLERSRRRGRIAYPAAVAAAAAGHGLPLAAEPSGVRAGARRQRRLRRRCGSGRSARPTGRRSWPRSCRDFASLAREAARSYPRRSRRLRLPLRHRRDASRNPIFEAFPLMRNCHSRRLVPSPLAGEGVPKGRMRGSAPSGSSATCALRRGPLTPNPVSRKGRGGSSLPRNRTDLR